MTQWGRSGRVVRAGLSDKVMGREVELRRMKRNWQNRCSEDKGNQESPGAGLVLRQSQGRRACEGRQRRGLQITEPLIVIDGNFIRKAVGGH